MRVWWAPSRIFWKLFICPCNKSWWDDEITTLSGQFLRLLKGMNTVILFWLIIYDEVISHR